MAKYPQQIIDINRKEFRRIVGYDKKRFDYPLTENSIVLDVGAYDGEWFQKIMAAYNPWIFAFEPVPQFYSKCIQKANSKVKVFNYGLGEKDESTTIYVGNAPDGTNGTHGDSTSLFIDLVPQNEPLIIQIKDVEKQIKTFGFKNISLAKINIEGAEFALLNKIIDNGMINIIDELQVQFHTIENSLEMWFDLRNKLARTHNVTWESQFVFENFKRI